MPRLTITLSARMSAQRIFLCRVVLAQCFLISIPFHGVALTAYTTNTHHKLEADDYKISFVDDNVRYPKDQWPDLPLRNQWSFKSWKGEKSHSQILIWTRQPISKVRVVASALSTIKGDKIPDRYIHPSFVRYVLTDRYAEGCVDHELSAFGSDLIADPLDTSTITSMPASSTLPVWIDVVVPAQTKTGIYQGIIEVLLDDHAVRLQVHVEVLPRVLPPPVQWSFDLDLWQHPAAIARAHQVPLWSTKHFACMKPYYQKLASMGQKCVTVSIIDEPWNHQTYDDYPSLIRWIKLRNGSWQYDYSTFDRYVSFVMSCGITQRINCYTMIPWKLSFAYFDQTTGRDTVLVAEPGSDAYQKHWKTMLIDFTKHLKLKGWFEKTSISVDERPLKSMQIAISILKQVDPGWKIALAGAFHPELMQDVFDYSIASEWLFDPASLANRIKANKPSTFYTCCVEAFPNGFTFSPPAESAWLAWYAAANGFTGYLRWAFNSWTKDPRRDSRYTAWPGGDTYQIYPGPWSSIRLEKLLEGIQDFEKIQIINKDKTTSGKLQAQELNQYLTKFKIPNLKQTRAQDMITSGKEILNRSL